MLFTYSLIPIYSDNFPPRGRLGTRKKLFQKVSKMFSFNSTRKIRNPKLCAIKNIAKSVTYFNTYFKKTKFIFGKSEVQKFTP